MVTKVYTILITYEGLENCLWRKVEISSNYRMDQLGYMILAAFESSADDWNTGEFVFECYNGRYIFPDRIDSYDDYAGFNTRRVGDLYWFGVGAQFKMKFQDHMFWLRVQKEEPMQSAYRTQYPFLLDGEGRGIVDDFLHVDMIGLVEQINNNGKTDEPIYHKGSDEPWDYRNFSLEKVRKSLKGKTKKIGKNYAEMYKL